MFETETGASVPAVTAEEMADVDRVAVEEVGIGLAMMMENAGRNLALAARSMTPEESVVVLAGGGGNGGGGLCAARHLANHGVDVGVALDRSPGDLEGVPARQCRILRATDATVGTDPGDLADAGLVVDALVGYGLADPLGGRAAELVERANGEASRLLSLDVPSGLDATTGERPGPAADPDCTLTLALPKTGLTDLDDLWLADIGIPGGVYDRLGIDYRSPFDGRYRVPLHAVDGEA